MDREWKKRRKLCVKDDRCVLVFKASLGLFCCGRQKVPIDGKRHDQLESP